MSNKIKKILELAIPIAGGIIVSRAGAKMILKDKDVGLQGALAQAGVAVGAGWVVGGLMGRQAGLTAAAAGVGYAGLRALAEKFPQAGIALGEHEHYERLLGPSIPMQVHDQIVNQMAANNGSGYVELSPELYDGDMQGAIPYEDRDAALRVGHLQIADDGMGGFTDAEQPHIHHGEW